MVPGGCLQPGLSEYDIEYRVHATRRMFEQAFMKKMWNLRWQEGSSSNNTMRISHCQVFC